MIKMGPSKADRLSGLEELLLNQTIDPTLVQTLILIENVPADIQVYRDRERHLESLIKHFQENSPSTQSETAHIVVFRHLLGSLYVNFEKFWGPTIRVIISLLNQSRYSTVLIKTLLSHLSETNDLIYNHEKGNHPSWADDRPDHVLHRNFIFQILAKFPQQTENNSKIFMDEFFRFAQEELHSSPFIEKLSRENLTSSSSVNADDQANCDSMKNSPDQKIKMQKRKTKETFITVSRVIHSFRDIGKVHRIEELRQLLMTLLCCRDSSIQKASLNCILIFKLEAIEPYVSKMFKLLDEKSVRSELTTFSADEESTFIQDEHRSTLMPILLRILFGRMIGKIGQKASGRDKADIRKTLVMRFIASCKHNEIMFFFGLLFDPIFKHTDLKYNELATKLDEMLDLERYVPVNKLQAMLGSVQSYIDSVAHLQEESLASVFKLICVISYHVVAPLKNPELSDKLSGKSLNSLRALRRECINIVAQYFKMFGYYPYSQDEIDFTFTNLIWPNTDGFIDKNHASPTPLLKLIEVFAAYKFYHALLIKRKNSEEDHYLLQLLVNLYTASKTTRPVLKLTASMFARILRPGQEEEDAESEDEDDDMQVEVPEIPMLQDRDAIIPFYDLAQYKITRELSFGEKILIGFIPAIFEKLQSNIKEISYKKSADHLIERDELKVLSILSEFLKNSEQSLIGARLLLTSLSSQKKRALILETLRTAQTLLRQVTVYNDHTITLLIADSLSYQRNIEQRRELCDLVGVLAQINSTLKDAHEILILLNSFDSEFVDIVKWNAGFQASFNYLDEVDEKSINQKELVKDSLTLLMHQVGFIMNNVDRYDYSIRENAVIFYEKLAQKLSLMTDADMIYYFIDQILLEKFFKRGLRETNDTIKHTYLSALRPIIVHCHEKNRTLSDFHMFYSDNLDLDFWVNIRHIQLHSRSKALARLVGNEDLHKVSPKTLSSYFMPLASAFLFSKAYKSVSSLTENSIKLIGLICKHLNWVTYESTLSYYLEQLTKANATYQRTNIKLITEIIKNFNFDITACEEAMQHDKENSKLEKRMRKRRGPEDNSNMQDTAISTDAPSGKRLNKSTAKMVYMSVTKRLIPRLESCLHEMTRVEFEHDKKMADYLPEKDEIKRIPIAFAIVQLLNLLPGRYVLFRDHLPSLFLKLSSFLKSKNEQVRRASRATLIKIMAFVGPAYMSDLLRVLKQNLDKGFQVHVLNYTIHSILDKLPLQYGDLDRSAHELIGLCFQEIFGDRSEDKEILQILAKTYEAKKTKSYDTLMILATHISADKLELLLSTIKGHLKTINEPRKVNKLSQCIQKVFTGLSKNEKFPLDKLFSFIQASIEESIPHLKVRQRVQLAAEINKSSSSEIPRREDRFIIRKDITRDRIKSKINERGNFHMIVENSLRLLLHTFEKNKILIKRKKIHQRKLDGLVALLSKCLKSSSPRCVMRALKCIFFIAQTKIDLPAFAVKSNSIVKKLFVLLNLYNGVGMVRGDNLEMISMCFKTITLLLLKCEHVQLSQDQIRALLTYIEQDLHDANRQGTAFATLHSLLKRKCESPELPEIMAKLSDLLVTTTDETVRTLTIKIWQTYLLDYKHEGSSLQTHLMKFMRQLDYEYIDGRKAVIKMLNVVVSKFPEALLREYFELMFHLLSQRIVNEESKEVRALVGRLIALLAQRLPEQQDYLLNKFVMAWASNDNTGIKLLGIKLLSAFSEANQNLFKSNRARMSKMLDLIVLALEKTPDKPKQVSIANDVDQDEDDEDSQENSTPAVTKLINSNDKLIYNSLRLFKRLLEKDLLKCTEKRHIEALKKIWHNISSSQLANWYTPTVITSCELYLLFINKTPLQDALNAGDPTTDQYLDWNAKRIVRTLCDRFLELLDRADESCQIVDYVTEAMVLLGQMICNSKATLDFEQQYGNSFKDGDIQGHLLSLDDIPSDGLIHDHLPYRITESKKKLDIVWLLVKVVMQARKEAAVHRLSAYHRREFVLKWTAAIAQELGPKRIAPYVALLMMTPVRELTDKGKDKLNESSRQDIVAMAEDLLKFIKSLMGLQMFNKMYSKVQLHYTKRRVDRKKREALSKVKVTKRNSKQHDNKAASQKKKRLKVK